MSRPPEQLTNPMTILSFVAIFAGLGVGTSPNCFNASVLVGGVFIGSALWWLTRSSAVALFRAWITSGTLRILNFVSGSVIFAFGLYSLSTSLFTRSTSFGLTVVATRRLVFACFLIAKTRLAPILPRALKLTLV